MESSTTEKEANISSSLKKLNNKNKPGAIIPHTTKGN